jgi:hypothetical protein
LDYKRVLEFHGLDQGIDALVGGALQFDAESSDGPDAESDELHVDFLDVFLELDQNLVYCVLVGQGSQNSQFFLFDVKWVLVGTEEEFEKPFEDVWMGLGQMADAFEGDKSDLFFLMVKRGKSLGDSVSNESDCSQILEVI